MLTLRCLRGHAFLCTSRCTTKVVLCSCTFSHRKPVAYVEPRSVTIFVHLTWPFSANPTGLYFLVQLYFTTFTARMSFLKRTVLSTFTSTHFILQTETKKYQQNNFYSCKYCQVQPLQLANKKTKLHLQKSFSARNLHPVQPVVLQITQRQTLQPIKSPVFISCLVFFPLFPLVWDNSL